MQISVRSQHIPDSPIRKLVPLADAAKQKGRTVYALNIGQPDLPTPKPFLDALHGYSKQTIAYGKSEGELEYRQGLARYYGQVGIDVNPEQIVVTVGGSEALLFAIQTACEPGDEVIVFEPFYTNYNTFAMMSGVDLVPVRTHANVGYHLPADSEIEAKISKKTKAILICSPNNPTGTVFTEDELKRIAALAKKHELFVISDEVYREFCYKGTHTSIMHLQGIDDRAILVDSISKRYSACGARIGCLVTKNAAARAAAVRMAQGRLCPPIVEQEASLKMTELGPNFFAPVRDEYLRRRDVCYGGLMKIPGVTCLVPNGAFYIMAEMPIKDCEAFARWLLTDFHLDNETVMVAPGPGFYVRGKYAQEGQGLNQIRLAYVLEVPKIERAMKALQRAVEVYGK
ncbi:MAG: pyridoxal phosphate-dependent aminotransferase [Deltaproteobacteria bacterium]|nr:pyridoxal phosphate-dependent aminotransferase [Deltaproteobacteria bacterium]